MAERDVWPIPMSNYVISILASEPSTAKAGSDTECRWSSSLFSVASVECSASARSHSNTDREDAAATPCTLLSLHFLPQLIFHNISEVVNVLCFECLCLWMFKVVCCLLYINNHSCSMENYGKSTSLATQTDTATLHISDYKYNVINID